MGFVSEAHDSLVTQIPEVDSFLPKHIDSIMDPRLVLQSVLFFHATDSFKKSRALSGDMSSTLVIMKAVVL